MCSTWEAYLRWKTTGFVPILILTAAALAFLRLISAKIRRGEIAASAVRVVFGDTALPSTHTTLCFIGYFRGAVGGAERMFTAFVYVAVGFVCMQQCAATRKDNPFQNGVNFRPEEVYDIHLGNGACSPAWKGV